ncbi:hypothetical protein FEM48_Zijuj04G0183700 [Ziziphus jujuba var. spinosa]|uniref:MADS-box domain-containing protein n=1 Tax=Ziziphus jujuba var. spinosa TaxID=714518 RepID=A0A978VLG0_ZIZJJ|nr:hypothetical protein FEM48_Zijuj04G0183700 [Ziziphus jujuba var. spinosa]
MLKKCYEKLKMELVLDEKSRKTTFQKRKRSMLKNYYEFSTLCGIDVCMITYGPKQRTIKLASKTCSEL